MWHDPLRSYTNGDNNTTSLLTRYLSMFLVRLQDRHLTSSPTSSQSLRISGKWSPQRQPLIDQCTPPMAQSLVERPLLTRQHYLSPIVHRFKPSTINHDQRLDCYIELYFSASKALPGLFRGFSNYTRHSHNVGMDPLAQLASIYR
ncbi:hypothetical protein C8Q75DRAFT_602785 [Abortiporus biennis]|nr:hypothetical protein C8Q75DRAFT_602785 [Abortiporus biennis]